ncbi:MAG: RNA methyltransferase [Candidatus Margulisbacteria bacterium]|nr:RNA methyltransferase [Candidatus Margulisiibacteriota bacterium]
MPSSYSNPSKPLLITSPQNSKIKQIYALQTQRKTRDKEKRFVLENPKRILDQIAQNPDQIDYVLYDHTNPIPNLPKTITAYEALPELLNKLSYLNANSGWFAVLKQSEPTLENSIKNLRYGFVLDHIATPSNLGAIIRTAAAFSIDAIFLTPGCTDPYHPDAIRAMAGTHFAVPIITLTTQTYEQLAHYPLILLDAHAKTHFHKDNLPETGLFVFGSEGQGIQTKFLQNAKNSLSLHINLNKKVESLNVAATAAIIAHTLSTL